MSSIEIKTVTEHNLSNIANIHLSAFPQSALTKLGPEAVRRYYHWQLHGPHDCHAIAAFEDKQMLGFCFGGVFRGALGGFLQKNKRFLFWRVLFRPWLLFNDIFRERLKTAFRSLRLFPVRKQEPKSTVQKKLVKSFSILSIAVDPAIQTKGVGKALMHAAEEEALRQGYDRMHLTVHPTNTNAVQFYLRVGWLKNEENPWVGGMYKILEAREVAKITSNCEQFQ